VLFVKIARSSRVVPFLCLAGIIPSMKDPNTVGICKRCGKPIYINELYFQQVGAEIGPWHHYDCMKKSQPSHSE